MHRANSKSNSSESNPLDRARSQSGCACCGAAIARPYGDLWDGRLDDYCAECATARCDAYPGDCGREPERA